MAREVLSLSGTGCVTLHSLSPRLGMQGWGRSLWGWRVEENGRNGSVIHSTPCWAGVPGAGGGAGAAGREAGDLEAEEVTGEC